MIRSLSELPDVPTGVPTMLVLAIPAGTPPAGQRCTCCCEWWMPIAAMHLRPREHYALTFDEWLIWHLHVCQHQQLGAPGALAA